MGKKRGRKKGENFNKKRAREVLLGLISVMSAASGDYYCIALLLIDNSVKIVNAAAPKSG